MTHARLLTVLGLSSDWTVTRVHPSSEKDNEATFTVVREKK